MITLLIDTSSADVSIAILKDTKILSSITKTIPNKHSDYTVSFIDKALKEANITPNDVKKIMVVTGPGSFTGLRIGVTIAKVYAYIKKIDIIPISSLKIRAISTEHETCLSVIDAKNNNYYIGLYDKNNNNIIEEKFTNLNNVLKIIEEYHPKIVSNQDGFIEKYPYIKEELNIQKIVAYYQNIPTSNPHLVNPNYLKLPQVLEEKKND